MKTKIRSYIHESFLCALGALLILSLLQPFGIDTMQSGRTLFLLGEAAVAFFANLLAYLIAECIPAYRRLASVPSSSAYIRRLLLHYLIFMPILSASLLSFNMWYQNMPLSWAWRLADGSFSFRPFLVMCFWVTCISLLIMIWEFYRFRTSRLEQELLDVRAINALLEARQQQLADASEQQSQEEPKRTLITLQGNAQNAHLTLCPEDIIYIESMSNYADIVYIEEDTTRHATLRITLKQLREQLAATECLVQCHRAFLVNLNFVRGLSVRSAGTYDLELFGLEKRVPVSRANADAIKRYLEK